MTFFFFFEDQTVIQYEIYFTDSRHVGGSFKAEAV